MKKEKSKKKQLALERRLKEERIRLYMLMLRTRYRYHKFLYYEVGEPKLTDKQFDGLERRFAVVCDHIERVYPIMFKVYQPRTWVGYNWEHKGA